MPSIYDIIKQNRDYHTKLGFSQNGLTSAKLILKNKFGSEKPLPLGIFERGKQQHLYYQENVFPAGKVFEKLELCADVKASDPNDEKKTIIVKKMITLHNFEVLQHEQLIYLKINGKMRISPADCVFHMRNENNLLLVDLKSTNSYALKHLTGIKPENYDQLNLYAYQYSKMTGMPIPFVMAIYISSNDWTDVRAYVEPVNHDLAIDSIIKMEEVDLISNDENLYNETVKEWHNHAICIRAGAATCPKYCNNEIKCLENFNIEFPDENFENHKQARSYLKKNKIYGDK